MRVSGKDFVDSGAIFVESGNKVWGGGIEQSLGDGGVRVKVAGGKGEDFEVR